MVACMRTGTRLTAGYRYTTLKDTTLSELCKENRQLKEANEILQVGLSFFAQAELDRKLK